MIVIYASEWHSRFLLPFDRHVFVFVFLFVFVFVVLYTNNNGKHKPSTTIPIELLSTNCSYSREDIDLKLTALDAL